eukprot:961413-Prorocentrum_minimum.AAC.2
MESGRVYDGKRMERGGGWEGILRSMHEGHKRPKRGVIKVVNTQDSQEQAPCATFWFLGLIQVRKGRGGGLEGLYRSSLDARRPQNPTN